MKKLVVCMLLSLPAWGIAQPVSTAVERAAARAVAQHTVHVRVQLAKPVYMSDVMYRPVRGKDMIIRTDYKEQKCVGILAAQKTQVLVPSSCVSDEEYRVFRINIFFPNGKRVTKAGKSIEVQERVARIRL